MKKLRILLVEDQLSERLNIMKVLNEYGAHVDTAVTFSRARDLAQSNQYDLVISELLLNHCPELQGDGVQFWNFFSQLHPKTPLIMVAEENMRLLTEFITQAGACPPIYSKPIAGVALKEILDLEFAFEKSA
jgi:DNA-binding NtrC family response regulator